VIYHRPFPIPLLNSDAINRLPRELLNHKLTLCFSVTLKHFIRIFITVPGAWAARAAQLGNFVRKPHLFYLKIKYEALKAKIGMGIISHDCAICCLSIYQWYCSFLKKQAQDVLVIYCDSG